MEEIIKKIEEKNLLINKNMNGITGAWMKEGKWVSDVDITSIHLENYPLILERLEIEGDLLLGKSQDTQLYYAIILYHNDGVLSCEQYVTDYKLEDAINTLNNRLIEIEEFQKMR